MQTIKTMNSFYTNSSSHSVNFWQKVILPLAILVPLFLLAEYFFSLFGTPGPITFFSLNSSASFAMNSLQLFTYPLAFGTPGEEIGLYWLLHFSFFLYVFWITGSAILESKGWRSLAALYCLGSVFAAFIALLVAKTGGFSFFYGGPTPLILSFLLFWTMLAPDLTVWVFFFFPIRAKWVTLFVLSFSLLQAHSLPLFCLLTVTILSTWGYALIACSLRLPFVKTAHFERRIIEYFSEFSLSFKRKEKIISFRSLQNREKNEEFFNKILDKIAKKGKKSLSFYERWKVWIASKNKKKKVF